MQLPGAPADVLDGMLEVVREMAAGHPAVDRVVGMTDAELSPAAIRERLGERFEAFYYAHDSTGTVCRRLAHAYPDAARICIGDAFGMLYPADFVARYHRGATPAARRRARAGAALRRLRGSELAPLRPERAVLVLPVDPSGRAFDDVALECCPKPAFDDAIRHCHANAAALRARMAAFLERSAGRARYLLLTEPYAEAGHMDADAEAQMVAEVVRTHCTPGAAVFVKPHPLESGGKAERLRAALGPAVALECAEPRFARYPVEIWIELLRACTVICAAYPVLSLKYAHGIDVVQPLDDAMIERWMRPEHRDWIRDGLRLYLEPLARLPQWDGRSVLWSGARQ